jgi:hypothetical protein
MKSSLALVVILAAIPSFALASTYECKTQDSSVQAHFQLENGVPVAGSLRFQGQSYDGDVMAESMEDYNEVPNQSVYVEVSLYKNTLLFNATFLPNSKTQMVGDLAIFSFNGDPMTLTSIACVYSAN